VEDITLPGPRSGSGRNAGPHNSPMPSTGYRLHMKQDLACPELLNKFYILNKKIIKERKKTNRVKYVFIEKKLSTLTELSTFILTG
jgi:hypothetical protein